MQTSLQVSQLTKSFGDKIAVKDLDLTVDSGEVFGFLGPNGAGKTTTLKTMTGLLNPSSGRVEINGISVEEEPEKAKRLFGYVPDEPVLYPQLKGKEFLNFVGDIYEVDRREQNKRIPRYLDLFDLEEAADQLIESYSHGMKSKLAIASELLHDPELLFLDEPTGGLDPKGARIMKDVLTNLVEKGKIVFMSTHILEIAEKICSRVGIINEGKLIADGDVATLRKDAKMKENQDLEEIFLELTGGEEYKAIIEKLE